MSRWRCGLLVVLFLLPLGLMFAPGVPHRACELAIDMQVGEVPTVLAGRVEVWVNGPPGPSLWQAGEPGVRQTYRFRLADYRSINSLRIDPTDQPDVPVWIYEVRIEGPRGTLHTFTAQDLAGWRTNAGPATLDANALALRAAHNEPQLAAGFPAIRLPGQPRHGVARLAAMLFAHDAGREAALLVLAVCALGVLVLGLVRGGRTAVAVVVASVPFTYAAMRLVARLGARPPDGRSAIGYAIYSGYPKSLEFLQGLLPAAVPAVLALLAVWLHRRFAGPPAPVVDEPVQPTPRHARIVLGLVLAGLACYFYPSLVYTCPANADPYPLGWDSNNGFVWQYLTQVGARPFRDFWYPYSGQLLFGLAFPAGDCCLAVHQFLLFGIFLFAIYGNTGRSLPATLAIFGSVFGLYASFFFEWPERYGLIVNVVLTHLLIDPRARRLGWAHVLFWTATAQAVLVEPASGLYAGVPVLVSLVLDALRSPAEFRAGLFGRLLREFAVPAIFVAGLGAYLAARGELAGFLDFVASFGTQAAYGAYPADFRDWLRLAAPVESFVLWSIPFLVGVGLVRLLGSGGQDRTGRVMLLVGVATAMLMLKQVVRPHMAGQMLILSVVGLLFFLFAGRKANAWQRGSAVLAAGLVCAHLVVARAPLRIGHQLGTAPLRLWQSFPFLALSEEEKNELTAIRFSPDHFQLTAAHREALEAVRDAAPGGPKAPLYVLSDDPMFYVFTGGRPYFHTNGYNAAPIAEQKHVVRLLTETPPRTVLWRATEAGMDAVPPVLRNPLIYEHVILHYVPDPASPQGPFVLLRPRRPDEPVAVDFWRERLGGVLHLGHLPRFSSIDRFPAPSGRPDEEIAEFLTVKVADPEHPPAMPKAPEFPHLGGYHPAGLPVAVPVECAGRRFTLVLSVVPGQAEYHVLLNRLWFWGALKKAGRSPELGATAPGIEARIERRAMGDGILY